MSLRDGERYIGTVTRGELIESSKGTPGFDLMLETDEGTISHTIWITERTKEYAIKDFAVLDVSESQLANASFLANELPLMVQGKEVAFGVKSEEYNGKAKLRCAWIGKPKAPKSATLEGSVAAMFGGKAEQPARIAHKDAGSDVIEDDIPF